MDSSRLDVVPIVGIRLTEQVDALVKATPCSWYWHRPIWRDYELARNPRLVDYSWAVTVDGVPVTAQLLTYNPEMRLLGLGDLPAPIALPYSDDPEVVSLMGERFAWIASQVEGRVRFRLLPVHSHFYRGAHLLGVTEDVLGSDCEEHGWVDESIKTRIIDLRYGRTADDLWSSLRKSYRHIIMNAHAKISVSEEHTHETWKICQAMHTQASGRQTRPSESWVYQDSFVYAGDASWFLARSCDTNEPVGFAYILRWKGWAYYASAASLRPNVSHSLQWAIMKRLKEYGVRYYEIGHQGEDMTKKGEGIEFFRRGFGGNDIAQPIYSSPNRNWSRADLMSSETVH